MATTYVKADQEVTNLLQEIMDKYHPVLSACEVVVDVLMARGVDKEGSGLPEPTLKLHGYPCAAIIKVTALKQRALGQGDALLTIDSATWEELSDEKQRAVLDHELEHLVVVANDGEGKPAGLVECDLETGEVIGEPLGDDLGRPKLKLKLHDWHLEGFKTIAERYGEAALEVLTARSAIVKDSGGQYVWDWAAKEKAAPKKVARPTKTSSDVPTEGEVSI
jgi:hypothetical protein